MRLSWAAAGAMRRRERGAIVNIGSTAAIWSVGTYAASKAWVAKATQGLSVALESTPVRALYVVPGFTRTEFHSRSNVDNSGVRSWLWLTPETVAAETLAALDAAAQVACPAVSMAAHWFDRERVTAEASKSRAPPACAASAGC